MTRTSLKTVNCSVAQFAEIFGDKWTLLILREAFKGVRTYTDFAKGLGVARNVLADRLTRLVDEGILIKSPVRPGVERYVYDLTPQGQALFPVLVAMTQWSDKWIFGAQGEPYRIVDKETGSVVQAVEVIARDGRMLGKDDVEYVPLRSCATAS